MTSVMKGVRVLEVAEYGMVPAAAAVLSDWGAEVIKVEHSVRGDPLRQLSAWGVAPAPGESSFLWDVFNRGKRSIGIDIVLPEGRQLVGDLAANADVFITNFLPTARKKLGIEYEDIRALNPSIIYARGSAYGPRGAEADKGGFDGTSYWLRSGVAVAAAPAGSDQLIGLPAPAFGDIQTGLELAGGIAAALFHRERTGDGSVVDISLLGAGAWAMQAYLVGANAAGVDSLPAPDPKAAPNPIGNQYRTRDGRFIALSMLQADRYWVQFCKVIGREDLANHPEYATMALRDANRRACISELASVFAERTLDEWRAILVQQEGQWGVVQRATDLNTDAQVWANGYLQEVQDGERTFTLVAPPVQFNETSCTLGPAPQHGQHTEEILLELGRDWDEIGKLKDCGAVS